MANSKDILNGAKDKMKKSGEALQRTLADIRAGQANASLLNSVKVEYYGAPTPLNHHDSGSAATAGYTIRQQHLGRN